MISAFFHSVFYDPLYNLLVALVAFVPGDDVGIAVVLLTILIRLLFLPLSLSAARTQRAIQHLQPKLKELKEKHKGDKEKEALETLALYREAKVNPFSSFFMALIQIPVLLALFWVFQNEPFPALNIERLYSITPIPASISIAFLGLVLMTGKSLVLAVLAGVTQYIQAALMLTGTMKPGQGSQGEFQRIMGFQLKYVFPILIAVIGYTTSSAIALYFVTSNIAGSLQELYVRRKLEADAPIA